MGLIYPNLLSEGVCYEKFQTRSQRNRVLVLEPQFPALGTVRPAEASGRFESQIQRGSAHSRPSVFFLQGALSFLESCPVGACRRGSRKIPPLLPCNGGGVPTF